MQGDGDDSTIGNDLDSWDNWLATVIEIIWLQSLAAVSSLTEMMTSHFSTAEQLASSTNKQMK